MTASRAARPVPTLRLPLPPRRPARSLVISAVAHTTLVVLLLWAGMARLGGRGLPGGGLGGDSGRERINFLVFPAGSSAPAAVALEAPPRLQAASLPALARIRVDVPPLALPHDTVSSNALASAAGVGGTGAGQGAGSGQGAGAGVGVGPGAGTGGGGDYIRVASPRTAILPPLAKVPGSVAGRTYRVRFSVAADGRVTQVDVEPPIGDAAYRREFLERMRAYQFVPAQTREGNVASVVTVTVTIQIAN